MAKIEDIEAALSRGKLLAKKAVTVLYVCAAVTLPMPLATIGIAIAFFAAGIDFFAAGTYAYEFYAKLFALIGVNAFDLLLFGVSLWAILADIKNKRDVAVWLRDAVPLEAYVSRLDIVSVQFSPYQVQFDFEYGGRDHTQYFVSDRIRRKGGNKVKGKSRIRAFSILLFVLCFAALPLGMIVAFTGVDTNDPSVDVTQFMWRFFFALPLPFASLLFGILVKAALPEAKVTKNIVGGAILAFIIGVYGCFSFLFAPIFDHDMAYVRQVSETTGIGLPEQGRISRQILDPGKETGKPENEENDRVLYISGVRFTDEDEIARFALSVADDERWLSALPTAVAGMLPPYYGSFYQDGDYFTIYNADTRQFNALPQAPGIYSCYYMTYYADTADLHILEYMIDVKLS